MSDNNDISSSASSFGDNKKSLLSEDVQIILQRGTIDGFKDDYYGDGSLILQFKLDCYCFIICCCLLN